MKKSTKFTKLSYSVGNQNKYTFNIPVVKNFVYENINFDTDIILNLFAGEKPIIAKKIINNDLYLKSPLINSEMESLELLKQLSDNSFDIIIFDPPYANVLALKKLYGINITQSDFNKWIWAMKMEIARVLKLGGKVISVGYETNGIGAIKGFKKEHLLIIAHGGLLRDTFIYTEIKVENGLHYKTWKQSTAEHKIKPPIIVYRNGDITL